MRTATITRQTRETDIALTLNLDGTGTHEIATGIAFFDHMLAAFAVHGGFDLAVTARGDLAVDGHHTVEDVGIVLGQAFSRALGDKSGVARFGECLLPMDEALARAVVDLSGRAFLVYDATFSGAMLGGYDPTLTEEFLRALTTHAAITLHARVEYGRNDHHKCEALFKAVARALRAATRETGAGVLSTKGTLT